MINETHVILKAGDFSLSVIFGGSQYAKRCLT